MLLDIHAIAGSQNGFDNSGQVGSYCRYHIVVVFLEFWLLLLPLVVAVVWWRWYRCGCCSCDHSTYRCWRGVSSRVAVVFVPRTTRRRARLQRKKVQGRARPTYSRATLVRQLTPEISALLPGSVNTKSCIIASNIAKVVKTRLEWWWRLTLLACPCVFFLFLPLREVLGFPGVLCSQHLQGRACACILSPRRSGAEVKYFRESIDQISAAQPFITS